MTGRRVGGGAALVGLVALAMVSAACGNGGDTAREPNDPAGLPSAADPVFCDAYIDASSASTESTAGVERLAAALGGDTPAAVAVALETLATLGPSPSGTPDVFARDEAWGTVDRHVKPLCRVAWRRGVVGAGSPRQLRLGDPKAGSRDALCHGCSLAASKVALESAFPSKGIGAAGAMAAP